MSGKTSKEELTDSKEKNVEREITDDSQGELIDSIKNSDLSEENKTAIVQQMEMYYSGPLPTPAAFGQYDKVLPGAAERILQMAEQEQNHRHEMEKESLRVEGRDSFAGIIVSVLLGVSALLIGAFVVLQAATNVAVTFAGTIFGLSGISTIVASIIKGTRRK